MYKLEFHTGDHNRKLSPKLRKKLLDILDPIDIGNATAESKMEIQCRTFEQLYKSEIFKIKEKNMNNLRHTTMDGITLFIFEMQDQHLENTVKKILKEMITAKVTFTGSVEVNEMLGALTDVESGDLVKDAKKRYRRSYHKLVHYIMELCIRNGMTIDVFNLIKLAFGRSEGVSTIPPIAGKKKDKEKK